MKGFFFQSGFKVSKPEDYVYSFFEPYVGIQLRIQVCKCIVGFCNYIYILYIQSSDIPSLKDVLFKFLKFAPDNDLAFDVSFGNKSGHSLILARAFYEVK